MFDSSHRCPDYDNILKIATKHNISIQHPNFNQVRLLANTVNQGVAAQITGVHSSLGELVTQTNTQNTSLVLILDRIQDPHNLGACLRTAAVAGVDAVIISRHDSCPLTAAVTKAACGAVGVLPIIIVSNISQAVQKLKQHEFWIYATDSAAPTSVNSLDVANKSALIIGSEHSGVKKIVQKNADFLLKIPSYGSIASLNASVAAGHLMLTFADKINHA